MLKQKLIHFESNSEFDKRKSEILDTSIVFIKDTNKIYTHGEEYQFVEWSILGTIGDSSDDTTNVPVGYSYYILAGDDSASPYWMDSEGKTIYVKDGI